VGKKFACPQPGQAGTKKELACPGNYKLQITNYKQIPNPKLQITNKEVSCGQILNASGEEHTKTFLIFKSWGKFFGL
jgi:hypothetical protein